MGELVLVMAPQIYPTNYVLVRANASNAENPAKTLNSKTIFISLVYMTEHKHEFTDT